MSEAQSKTGPEEEAAESAADEAAGEGQPPEAGADADKWRAEAEKWKSSAYRHAADLENLRRRFAKEREDIRKFGVESLLKDLLPVVDNLERAIHHAEEANPVAEGVRMVLRQFTTTLANRGATPFDPKGEPFDPQFHEAMTQMDVPGAAPGSVVEVFQRGWMLHDRLVRPAMVVVAKAPESAAEVDAPEDAADEEEDTAGEE